MGALEKLQKLSRNTFLFNGQEVKVYYAKEEGSQIKVVTDKQVITRPMHEAENLYNEFQKLESKSEIYFSSQNKKSMTNQDQGNRYGQIEQKPVQVQLPSIVEANRGSLNELRETLMDNINKLKTDKKYIDQSKEINNNVKTIISLAKAEIEYLKLLRKDT